jgi:type IV pilus assembly protein PilA
MVRNNEKGFTLIELLVVIAIIGILAAVAIPQFAKYRESAICSGVESDVANTVIAAEGAYASNQDYQTATAVQSAGNSISITNPTKDAYDGVTGSNPNCTKGSGTFTFTTATGVYSW